MDIILIFPISLKNFVELKGESSEETIIDFDYEKTAAVGQHEAYVNCKFSDLSFIKAKLC